MQTKHIASGLLKTSLRELIFETLSEAQSTQAVLG